METYPYMSQMGKENEKVKEDLAKLEVMEYLRKCSGREFDKPVTLADWEDTSTRPQEIRDMMRFCGLHPWNETSWKDLPKLPEEPAPTAKVITLGCGFRKFPFIVDPDYFKPRKTRPAKRN